MTNIALSLSVAPWVLWVGGLAVVMFLFCLPRLLGIVYIPHTQVGIIEKIWSSKGSLREGVYAINLALFVVITEERVFSGPVRESADRYESWKAQLASLRAFDPVVIGSGDLRHFQANISDTSASEAGAPPSLADKIP